MADLPLELFFNLTGFQFIFDVGADVDCIPEHRIKAGHSHHTGEQMERERPDVREVVVVDIAFQHEIGKQKAQTGAGEAGLFLTGQQQAQVLIREHPPLEPEQRAAEEQGNGKRNAVPTGAGNHAVQVGSGCKCKEWDHDPAHPQQDKWKQHPDEKGVQRPGMKEKGILRQIERGHQQINGKDVQR